MELGDPYPTKHEMIEIDQTLCAIADAGRALVPQWLGEHSS